MKLQSGATARYQPDPTDRGSTPQLGRLPPSRQTVGATPQLGRLPPTRQTGGRRRSWDASRRPDRPGADAAAGTPPAVPTDRGRRRSWDASRRPDRRAGHNYDKFHHVFTALTNSSTERSSSVKRDEENEEGRRWSSETEERSSSTDGSGNRFQGKLKSDARADPSDPPRSVNPDLSSTWNQIQTPSPHHVHVCVFLGMLHNPVFTLCVCVCVCVCSRFKVDQLLLH
ncbi:uncharacterized protein LOC122882652 [Siniperca chuatsi]|uniref:uncharacterized protein LOC122882652 n=1 Tax=Siniperca chuatsi TaxID=119488 RepID=UPI001CE1F51A|nr:uncharacterized protein LOC122882652 [Siniperca chuatsi]